ncbi:putative ankyrin repeat protein RF_0580 [Harmonia axyridis]|uniref:putative ankyrin repeat protein RF_0580 n=1 Tax=Harmonia axyridis TaxID=115357 RepID=UPI001E2759F6|nr:putative ankyrin repeat protein RF_0580 [Harmonia axyridis]
MEDFKDLTESFIQDMIVNCGSHIPISYVYSYIKSKKSDISFQNYYLKELIKKRTRTRFSYKDYGIIFCLLCNGAQPFSTCELDDEITIYERVLQINDVYLIELFKCFINPQDVPCEKSLKLILNNFVDDEDSFLRRHTPLHMAATLPNANVTITLLNKKLCCEEKTTNEETPIFFAVKNNQMEQVKTLLKYGANLRARDINSNTVLHALCSEEGEINIELLEFLLNVGCDPNSFGKNSCTPLQMLAENGRINNALECAELLIRRGADVNLQNLHGDTVLHTLSYSCDESQFILFLELLLKSKADTNIVNHDNKTFLDELLLDCCHSRRHTILKHLILLDINGKYQFCVNPIHCDSLDVDFQKRSRKELLHLRSRKIAQFQSQPEYSLVRILSSTVRKVSRLCWNQTLITAMSEFKERKFPIYGRELKCKFEAGLRLFLEQQAAHEFFTVVSKGKLNYYTIIEILKYIPVQEVGKCSLTST